MVPRRSPAASDEAEHLFPPTGHQNSLKWTEWKRYAFHEKCMATQVAADVPVKNGRFLWSELVVGTTNKVSQWSRVSWPMGWAHLLLSEGHSCYRPRKTEERKCKSIRGCTVGANLNVLNLIIIKKGRRIFLDSLTPHGPGPKGASRICRLLSNLSKEDEVCQYAVRKP